MCFSSGSSTPAATPAPVAPPPSLPAEQSSLAAAPYWMTNHAGGTNPGRTKPNASATSTAASTGTTRYDRSTGTNLGGGSGLNM